MLIERNGGNEFSFEFQTPCLVILNDARGTFYNIISI